MNPLDKRTYLDNLGGIAQISLKPIGTSTWNSIAFIFQSARLQIAQQNNAQGNAFRATLSFRVHMDSESLSWLEENNFKRMIARVVNHQGQTFIIGSDYTPLSFVGNVDSGEAVSNSNALQFTLQVRLFAFPKPL